MAVGVGSVEVEKVGMESNLVIGAELPRGLGGK